MSRREPVGHLTGKMQEEVGEILLAMGFDLSDFRFEHRPDPKYPGMLKLPPRLSFLPDRRFFFEFRFSGHGQGHTYKYAPAEGALEYDETTALPWNAVIVAVTTWGDNLHAELAATDPWSELAGGQSSGDLLLPEGVDPDEPFSKLEQEHIREQVRAFYDQLSEEGHGQGPTRAEFEALEEAVEKLSRRGWARTAGGVALQLTRFISKEEAVVFYHKALEWIGEAARLLPPS